MEPGEKEWLSAAERERADEERSLSLNRKHERGARTRIVCMAVVRSGA